MYRCTDAEPSALRPSETFARFRWWASTRPGDRSPHTCRSERLGSPSCCVSDATWAATSDSHHPGRLSRSNDLDANFAHRRRSSEHLATRSHNSPPEQRAEPAICIPPRYVEKSGRREGERRQRLRYTSRTEPLDRVRTRCRLRCDRSRSARSRMSSLRRTRHRGAARTATTEPLRQPDPRRRSCNRRSMSRSSCRCARSRSAHPTATNPVGRLVETDDCTADVGRMQVPAADCREVAAPHRAHAGGCRAQPFGRPDHRPRTSPCMR